MACLAASPSPSPHLFPLERLFALVLVPVAHCATSLTGSAPPPRALAFSSRELPLSHGPLSFPFVGKRPSLPRTLSNPHAAGRMNIRVGSWQWDADDSSGAESGSAPSVPFGSSLIRPSLSPLLLPLKRRRRWPSSRSSSARTRTRSTSSSSTRRHPRSRSSTRSSCATSPRGLSSRRLTRVCATSTGGSTTCFSPCVLTRRQGSRCSTRPGQVEEARRTWRSRPTARLSSASTCVLPSW